MNVEYKRDLNHNYLILTGKQQEGESYQSKMMERNKVHGILPCSARYVDDVVKYYYDISSKQPLAAAFSIRKMNYQLVSSIFMQMEQIFHELDNYLLDSSRILLDVRYMYWDVEAEKIHFIFYPLQEKGEDSVQKFAEELLNLVDYADKKAVDAVYWFYQKATAENFTLCEAFAYFKEQGVGADLSMKEAQNANTGGNRQQERTDVDWHEQSGNKADYRDGYQDYDTEDEDTENESDERFRGRKKLLPAIVCILVFAAAGYILTHYKLTVNEMLAGCGFLAMLPVAFLVHLIRKWQKKIAEQKSRKAVECRREKERQVSQIRETQETEEVYGETTYFGAEGWQQERCLEGRYKGKEILIAITETPFVIGKLQGAVSFVLSDVTISRMHAQFIEKDGKLFLQDMNSKNGTYKNGVAMSAEEELEVYPGDEIRFGRLRFTYH